MNADPAEFRLRDSNPDFDTHQPAIGMDGHKGFAARLSSSLQRLGLNAAELSGRSGVPKSTLSRYGKGESLPKSEHLFPLADALQVDPRWLLTGVSSAPAASLATVDNVEWVDVPEHDLRELTDETAGPTVATTPFRKDWLNRTFGRSSGLWLARLPADLPRYDLREGDLVFLCDLAPGEPPRDGAIYIVRVWGHLTVVRVDSMQDAQMSSVANNLEDRRLAFRNIGHEDGKATLVARVLGVPIKRL